jgi:hypothetical protein
MSALASLLANTPVITIEEVLATMRGIEAALDPADGVACFNKLYLAVTSNVLDAQRGGDFANKDFLGELDVQFGNLYFAALSALETGGRVPRAWAPLFQARSRTDLAPIQFAFAGMNAHINRDLPVGIVAACEKLGLSPKRPSPESRDYDRVNDLLATTEAEVRDVYFTPLMKSLHRELSGVDDVVAMWGIREARAGAWINADALWALRSMPALRDAHLEALDRLVGFAGRGLLVSTQA